MKRFFLILSILTLLSHIACSQTSNANLIKSVFLPIDTAEISLRNNSTIDFLITLLNISNDYEFKTQTIEGTQEQANFYIEGVGGGLTIEQS